MGRHGGGSRSGGSHRSSSGRSHSGSRSGGRSGSGYRKQKTPFIGCYNRSYYDRRGRLHTCYTNNVNYGKKSGWNFGVIVLLIFITLQMCLMLGIVVFEMVEFGGKVDGDRDRIFIQDNADVLTDSEEEKVLTLMEEVYDASGMPVTVWTDDFSWKDHYTSIEAYSEELYYNIGMDEDAMIILFTIDDYDGWYDWEYDMYCGDDTTKCLSDDAFDKLLDSFQKGMAGQDLYEALDYAWTAVMGDLAKTSINGSAVIAALFVALIYGIFYIVILRGVKEQNAAYKYFKNNPDKLSTEKMTLYSECPNCGAPNTTQSEVCSYCGSILKISDDKTTFVKPKE